MHKIWFTVVLTCLLVYNSIEAQTPAHAFPQHTTYTAGSIKPTGVTQSSMDKAVKKFYDKWKARYLVNGCEPNQYYVFYNYEGFADPADAISVSESQGYGMVITALMAGYDVNAKLEFDGLYNYYKAHPSIIDPVLMGWQQVEGCINTDDADAATDGDMDIAYGLLLAHAQWGSAGAINYLSEAENLINAIYNSEINHNNQAIKLGDWASGSASSISYCTRPSDFMCDHFRSFKAATGDANWDAVTNRAYTVISAIQTNYASTTGLVCDFVRKTNTSPEPAPANFLESPNDGGYYYNSCRVPWRIATDYLMYGDSRAFTALSAINSWIKTATASTPSNIKSGYALSGTVLPGSNYNDLSFQAPFAVSAMISNTNQTWLNSLWSYMQTVNINRDGYFGNSIKMISMITISGNWWAPDPAILKTINIDELSNAESLHIYPNPCIDKIYTTSAFTIDTEHDLYSIINLTGDIIKQGVWSNVLSVESLPSGVYILQVTSNSGAHATKFIKL